MSCLVGGIRWQVQELRITSGNVSVGMLLLSVTGSLLPASLVLSGQLKDETGMPQQDGVPTLEELQFSRVNAFVMMFMYGCYLIFQLGTHKEEFDDEENVVESANGNELVMAPHFTSRHGRQNKARRNNFCLRLFGRFAGSSQPAGYQLTPTSNAGEGDVEMRYRGGFGGDVVQNGDSDLDSASSESDGSGGGLLPQNEAAKGSSYANGYFDEYNELSVSSSRKSETESARRRKNVKSPPPPAYEPGRLLPLGLVDPEDEEDPRKFLLTYEYALVMSVGCSLTTPFSSTATSTAAHVLSCRNRLAFHHHFVYICNE